MTVKIEIYEDALSDKVLESFDSVDSFVSWINGEMTDQLYADQVAINDRVMYGWDEIEDELNRLINL